MTINVTTHDLPDGKLRRVAVDTDAPAHDRVSGLFAGLDPQAVALWDVRITDGEHKGVFLLVRPDLQGQGYLKKLAPHMAELSGGDALDFVNVSNPRIDSLKQTLESNGVEVNYTTPSS